MKHRVFSTPINAFKPAVLVLPLCFAFCLTNTQTPVQPDTQKGSVYGFVCDAKDSVSLPGVTVRLVGDTVSVVSDSDGRFELTDIASGEQAFYFKSANYASATKLFLIQSNKVFASDTVYLSRDYCVIAGRAYESDSTNSISTANVELWRVADSALVDSTKTDSTGSFVLTLISPDSNGYRISVGKENFQAAELSDTLAAGDSLFLTVQLAPYLTVAGMVVEAGSSLPVTGAQVAAGGDTATSDSLGRFVLKELVHVDTGHVFSATAKYFEPNSLRDTISKADLLVGPIMIQRKLGSARGFVRLQGQNNHSGIIVKLGPSSGVADTTDSLGEIWFPQVPAGMQPIVASKEKFALLSDTIEIQAADTTQIQMDLPIQSGTIQTRVDWHFGGSPYTISDTLEVTNSGTLYVHPAVEIQMANASLLFAADSGFVSIKGVPDSLITVLPGGGITTYPKIDIGFQVQDTNMAYTMIVNTTVYCRQGPRIHHCLFVDSGRADADTGLHIIPSSSGAIFDHCDFIGVSSNTAGIFVRDSTFATDDGTCEVMFSNCIFYRATAGNTPFLISNNGGNIQAGLANSNLYNAGTSPDSLFAIADIDTQQIWHVDPLYKDPGGLNFHLQDSSGLAHKSTDNGHIGALGVSTMQYFEPRERPKAIR